MKLYHASLEIGNITEVFVPRIPVSLMECCEDDETPRVCFSSSVSGCFSSCIWGGFSFEDLFWDEGKCVPIRIYEFDTTSVLEGNLKHPDYLYMSDKVRDAKINNEYWVVNQEIKPIRSYLINVLSFEEYIEDDISYEDKEHCKSNNITGDEYEKYVDGVFSVISARYSELEPSLYSDVIYTDRLNISLGIDMNNIDIPKIEEDLKNLFLNYFVPDCIRKCSDDEFLNTFKFNIDEDGQVSIDLNGRYGFVVSEIKRMLIEEIDELVN